MAHLEATRPVNLLDRATRILAVTAESIRVSLHMSRISDLATKDGLRGDALHARLETGMHSRI